MNGLPEASGNGAEVLECIVSLIYSWLWCFHSLASAPPHHVSSKGTSTSKRQYIIQAHWHTASYWGLVWLHLHLEINKLSSMCKMQSSELLFCDTNEAYKMSQAENHQWLQSIHYLLHTHSFSDIWNNPSVPGDTFHKAFKLRADDQFNQSMIATLQLSSRFTTLKEISENRGHDSYIHNIRSPRIRNIFLRLRIDMNIISTSRISKIYCLPVHSVPENPKQSNTLY